MTIERLTSQTASPAREPPISPQPPIDSFRLLSPSQTLFLFGMAIVARRFARPLSFRELRGAAQAFLDATFRGRPWGCLDPNEAEAVLIGILKAVNAAAPAEGNPLSVYLTGSPTALMKVINGTRPLSNISIVRLHRVTGIRKSRLSLLQIARQLAGRARKVDYDDCVVTFSAGGRTEPEIRRLRQTYQDEMRNVIQDEVASVHGHARGGVGAFVRMHGGLRHRILALVDPGRPRAFRTDEAIDEVERILRRPGHLWYSLNQEELRRAGIRVQFV